MKEQMMIIKNKYFSHYLHRTLSFTFLSFLINLSIGLFKLAIGLYFHSYWFIHLASYYIMLSLIKGRILWVTPTIKRITNKSLRLQRSLTIYHNSGYFILFLGILYFLLCLWLYYFNESIVYPQYILFGVVAIAFCKIGNAIYGLWSVKKHRDPLLSIIKLINFLDACVSIVAIQCALLTMEKSSFASSSSALLGVGVSFMFVIIGIYLVHKRIK